MDATIYRVEPDTIAEAVGLQPGDQVLAVNGKTDLEDLFDYQFELADTEAVELHVRHADGEEEIFELEKDPDEDLGIVFTSPIFTPIKTCTNACPFCFIDQQPDGLRPSLYIKDDDYRLSYFNNTYITLTNLSAKDRARIERLRPGPLYISVHATDPATRERLLINRKAGRVMDELGWLAGLDIPFHCQVVLCPGINDGPILDQTLRDLASLQPAAQSVAVVPLGLTQHRGHLPDLVPVDEACARRVVAQVEAFQAEHGSGFAFASDEFYLKAGLPLPRYEAYGDFPQLDDGVGPARMLVQDFFALEDQLPERLAAPETLLLLTGEMAAMTLRPIIDRLNRIEGLFIDVLPVASRFWGEAVTVAGLITGQDIRSAVAPLVASGDLTRYSAALLPSVMLRNGWETHPDGGEFLDSETLSRLSVDLGLPVRVVADPHEIESLLAVTLGPLENLLTPCP